MSTLAPLALALLLLFGAEYITRRAPGVVRWTAMAVLWLAAVFFLFELMGDV